MLIRYFTCTRVKNKAYGLRYVFNMASIANRKTAVGIREIFSHEKGSTDQKI